MTQKDKELLLKDLCARLPYHPILKWTNISDGSSINGELKDLSEVTLFFISQSETTEVKPYLRPMSSMTEEEFESLKKWTRLEFDQLELTEWDNGYKTLEFYLNEIPSYVVVEVFDFLNTHHFDYRGLIEKGLALEAPEGMYRTE